MTKPALKTCKTCRYAKTHFQVDEDGVEWLECHRFPPSLPHGGKIGVWPDVPDDQSCGEWGARDVETHARQCLFCGDRFAPSERGRRADAKFCCDEHRITFNSRRRSQP